MDTMKEFWCIAITVNMLFEMATSHMAPLELLPAEKIIPDEYLVLLAAIPGAAVRRHRVNDIAAHVTRHRGLGCKFKVLQTLEFGSFSALYVRAGEEELTTLRSHSEVTMVEPNFIVKLHDTTSTGPVDNGTADSSGDPFTTSTRTDHNCVTQDSGLSLWGLTRLSYRDLPDYDKSQYAYEQDGGHDVTAYVIDSGVYVDHQDFEGRAVRGFTAADVASKEGEEDLNGHGTHVAGTIAGKTYGVAKKARIVAVKALDYQGIGTGSDVFAAVVWTCDDFRVKRSLNPNYKAVINLSLGIYPASALFDVLIEECTKSGILSIVAAGNEFADACLSSPSRVPEALTVASSDMTDTMSSFSNYGTCVDVFAPGEYILSTYIGDPQASVLSQGTSMSAPHVAGVAARILSAQADVMSPQEVKAKVFQLASAQRVSLRSGAGQTANRLLYMPCGTPDDDDAPSIPPFLDDEDSGSQVVSFSTWTALLTLALLARNMLILTTFFSN